MVLDPQPFQKVLITGAGGFIGSHLAERCLQMGAEVVGLDCFDDFYDPGLKRSNVQAALQHPNYSLVEADIRDRDTMQELIGKGGFDVIMHLAARAGVRPSLENPALYFDVNVQGTLSLLDAVRNTNPNIRFVMASSSSVYGGLTQTPFSETDEVSCPVSPYAASKKSCEVLAYTYHHLYKIPISALRFFTVYGPRQRPEMAIAKFAKILQEKGSIPMFGDGSTARDYTYIDDIIDGVVRAMECCQGYEVYNLGESRTTTLADLISQMGEAFGVTPQIEELPLQPGDVTITYANIDKAREHLGYDPHTLVVDGLSKYAEWLRGGVR
ncbi:MAG: GDP-mannose 4,6-dehydratase [Planctomycetota bacterium]|jgi:UDP-glucuronate 4-epimerase|nr:GDP-mannose 4,6-dehydratase [Planctomycetota bacterium]MDP6941724.1 GDP-mannose 4,6-dehydratase [Planctomycetota bacterium]